MFVEIFKVDLEKIDKLNSTPFIFACDGKATDVIKYLL